MWLALETSAELASVAVGPPGEPGAQIVVEGHRRHASQLLPAIEQALHEAGVTAGEITGVVVADGPGSFTGLRVAATVAKALAHDRGWPLRAAPSLLAMAFGAWWDAGAPAAGRVRVLSDALRGEVYAAQYRLTAREVTVELAAGVFKPGAMPAGLEAPDLLVRRIPVAVSAILPPLAVPVVEGDQARPAAQSLLRLLAVGGGTVAIADVPDWEPAYGRPAEAQARWEAAHGRPLPDPGSAAR